MRRFTVPFDFEPPALRRIGLAVERVQGVNLAQGLCLLPVPDAVIAGAERAMREGHNRYSLAQGIIELRLALSARLLRYNSLSCSADSLIITPGSTGAFEVVCEYLSSARGRSSHFYSLFIHTTVIHLSDETP